MHRAAITLLMLLICFGCTNRRIIRGPEDDAMFGANRMRIHPIFSQVDDWSGDGKPDGVEALVEFHDSFGDPTKARGVMLFELYEYQGYNPDPRGERVAGPWSEAISTLAQQQEHWSRTSRTYAFRLIHPGIDPRRSYVLMATYTPTSGGDRLFDRVVIEAQPKPRSVPANADQP